MKQFLFLCLCAFGIVQMQAQEKDAPETRLSLDGFAGFNQAHIADQKHGIPSASFGINARLFLTKRLSLQGGLEAILGKGNLRHTRGAAHPDCDDVTLRSGGLFFPSRLEYGPSCYADRINQKQAALLVPFSISFKSSHRFYVTADLKMTPMFLARKRRHSYIEYADHVTSKQYFALAMGIGIGFGYQINDQFDIFINQDFLFSEDQDPNAFFNFPDFLSFSRLGLSYNIWKRPA